MDFFTTHEAGVAITIDGVAYTVPLLRNPALKQWAARLRKQYGDEATAGFGDPVKAANFLIFAPAPPVDIADAMLAVTSPDGADFVVEAQLEAAGVPADVRRKFLDNVHPDQIRALAAMLTRRDETLASLGVNKEADKQDPLPQPAGESGGSPGTGQPSTPASDPSTT